MEVFSMRKHGPQVLAVVAVICFGVAGFFFLNMKWYEANSEAQTRCVDPTVRKERTVEGCVSEMMLYYHMNSRLPQIGVVVAAQTQPLRAVRPSTITVVVKDNIYLFTPGDDGETSDDVQLDRTLRNMGDKYHITGLVITERRRYSSGNIVLFGIAQVRIIVEPK